MMATRSRCTWTRLIFQKLNGCTKASYLDMEFDSCWIQASQSEVTCAALLQPRQPTTETPERMFRHTQNPRKKHTAQQACNRNDMLMHGPPARNGHARSRLCHVGVRVHDPPGGEQCKNGICHEARMLTVTEQRIALQTSTQGARHKKSNAPVNIAWHTGDGQ